MPAPPATTGTTGTTGTFFRCGTKGTIGTFLTVGTVRNEKNGRNEKNDGNEMPVLRLFRSYRFTCGYCGVALPMSPLRHSPLARPVPPPPHAWEANVTYRSGLPRLRGRWPAGPERARDEKNDGNEMPILGPFRSYRSLSQNRSKRSGPVLPVLKEDAERTYSVPRRVRQSPPPPARPEGAAGWNGPG